MKYEAYWISPSGKIYGVDESSHIDYILQNSEMFGLTRDDIVKVYKKYKEKLGVEGKARHEIMLDLIKRGWIRCRFVKKWMIQTYKLNKSISNHIWDFVNDMFQSKEMKRYDDIYVHEVYNDNGVMSSAEDILKGNGLFESYMKDKLIADFRKKISKMIREEVKNELRKIKTKK